MRKHGKLCECYSKGMNLEGRREIFRIFRLSFIPEFDLFPSNILFIIIDGSNLRLFMRENIFKRNINIKCTHINLPLL